MRFTGAPEFLQKRNLASSQDDYAHLRPDCSKRNPRQPRENSGTHQQTIWIHFWFGIPQQVIDFFKPSLKTVPSRHDAATCDNTFVPAAESKFNQLPPRWVRSRGAEEPEPRGHQVRPVPPPPPHWGDFCSPDPRLGVTATRSRSDTQSRIPPGSPSRQPTAPSPAAGSLRRGASA